MISYSVRLLKLGSAFDLQKMDKGQFYLGFADGHGFGMNVNGTLTAALTRLRREGFEPDTAVPAR